jgi:hypothetical protein
MTDQLQIGEMTCRILTEFRFLPEIVRNTDSSVFAVNTTFKGKQILFATTTLEDCLAECYNRMMNIREGVNAGGQ